MKIFFISLAAACIALQTPAWALRSSSYTSTLSENEDLKRESSVRYNADLKQESSFKANQELKEQESSLQDTQEKKKQQSSFRDNEELKKETAVKTGDYDTPILQGDD